MTTLQILQQAKAVKTQAALLTTQQKNDALFYMATCIEEASNEILSANLIDINAAKDVISETMLDRLVLNKKRILTISDGIKALINLSDPIGEVLQSTMRGDGLVINKISVPIGVIAVIYESRPNVTADAAALSLKSGNVCVLRTGKEAYNSASAIIKAMRAGLQKSGLSPYLINLVEDTSRNSAAELMTATEYVDLLIPRGGKGLISACVQNAKVPCIQTGTGICHVYVDEYADLDKALKIVENAKCSRPSVCNAMEVCIVHSAVAAEFLPKLWDMLVCGRTDNPVKFKLDQRAYAILRNKQNCFRAKENDYDTEFLDYVMAVKIVDGVNEAIAHVSQHSTNHSDCIISENEENINLFTHSVDSAAVYVNASTRFTDGGEFGLGCEMGISTQKLHARGPMGLKELTTYKYVVTGKGNVR